MKTRIKIIEYNSGKREFICQSNEFHWSLFFMLFCTIIGIPIAIYYLCGDWRTMYHQVLTTGGVTHAIFDNIQDAKKCIDKQIGEWDSTQRANHQAKVKKTYKVKYP